MPRPRRLSRVAWTFIVAFAVGGAIFLAWSRITDALATDRAVVATRDIPAFTVVLETDVVTTDRAERDVPREAIRDKNNIVGRYSLQDIPADEPVVEGMLGGAADDGRKLPFALALTGGPNVALGGRLSGGDEVDILLTPTVGSSSVPRIRQAIVLDEPSVSSNQWTILVGLRDELSDEQAAAVARGDFAIVRRAE